jgi:hypothetical protein
MNAVTREVAMYHRGEFPHVHLKNRDGTPVRCRVTGACKTWKTRPTEFRLPVKHGLRDSFYIEPHNASDWRITDDDYKRVRRAILRERFGLAEFVPLTILRDRMIDEGIDSEVIDELCAV